MILYPDDNEEEYRNPELVSRLWAEWVCIVCKRQEIPTPTATEWEQLRAKWYYDKAPIDSVADLKRMREVQG